MSHFKCVDRKDKKNFKPVSLMNQFFVVLTYARVTVIRYYN